MEDLSKTLFSLPDSSLDLWNSLNKELDSVSKIHGTPSEKYPRPLCGTASENYPADQLDGQCHLVCQTLWDRLREERHPAYQPQRITQLTSLLRSNQRSMSTSSPGFVRQPQSRTSFSSSVLWNTLREERPPVSQDFVGHPQSRTSSSSSASEVNVIQLISLVEHPPRRTAPQVHRTLWDILRAERHPAHRPQR